MNPEEWTAFYITGATVNIRQALIEERNRLRFRLTTRDVDIERTPEEMDTIQANVRREAEACRLNADRAALRQVDEALWRLDRGTYGICAECEGAIPRRRLDAVPSAALCVRCQERAERSVA